MKAKQFIAGALAVFRSMAGYKMAMRSGIITDDGHRTNSCEKSINKTSATFDGK